MQNLSGFYLAFVHAWRDLRGGLRHLYLLLICLTLGVAVMSCIGSLIAGLKSGIDREAKSLLGGDVEIRNLYKPIPYPAVAWLTFNSQSISRIADMRAMAESGDNRTLVELKGIDRAWPLYGALELAQRKSEKLFAYAPRLNRYGAAVDQALLNALDLKLGDTFKIGDAIFAIRAVIAIEPDRSVSGLTLGPRVLVSKAGLRATNLIRYGSLINYRYRIKLTEHTNLTAWKKKLAAQFPNSHWNLRDWHDSAPGLMRQIDRLALFFALTGITSLIVAGLGIANAAGIYMWSKRRTIAALKCLGASARHIRLVYLLQLLAIGTCAITAGLVIGTLAEFLLFQFLDDMLPVRGERGLYGEPLLLSAALGLLTLLLFSLPALREAGSIKPATLFRGDLNIPSPIGGGLGWGQYRSDRINTAPLPASPLRGEGRRRLLLLYALLIIAMAVLAIRFTGTVTIPLYFTAGLLVSLTVFYGISAYLRRAAQRNAHTGKYGLTLSMALANLARPGAATASMVTALGIGMTLLIALALVGSNLHRQLEQELPAHAPAFFLGDIQPPDLASLEEKLKALPHVTHVASLPMVRGRIIRLNDTPADKLSIQDSARWAIQGDRGLTWAAAPPENASIVKGEWWPADYKGPPLVSFDVHLARGMGLTLGDTITLAALDKEITAKITSLREIEWGTMEMNFAIVLSPGALDGLPITYVTTVSVPPEGEKAVQKLVAKDFPQIAVVQVRQALSKLSSMLEQISNAVLVTSAITILCGILVMASAIHASLHKRIFDTVMLKVLGVTRQRILRIYLTEFALAALSAALASIVIGVIAAWAIMQLMVFSHFIPMPHIILATLTGSLTIAVILGLLATRAALQVRPLSLLRNE